MKDCSDHQKERLTDWGLYALYELLSLKFERLETQIQNIMSAISDFKTKQDAHNAKIDAAVAGLTADIEAQTALIQQLQSTQGQITPEDQALLDEIDSRNAAIAAKLEALDALNPPSVPPTP